MCPWEEEMEKVLLLQFVTLSIYTVFVGFCFCDGFNLPVQRKLFCFIPFVLICFFVMKIRGQLDLELILPLPTLMALLLCINEHKKLNKIPRAE